MLPSFTNIPDTTLHALFTTQARNNPDKIALVDGDTCLTYRELDILTNQLANHLRQYDIQANDPVGILLEKCHEYIIACIAILKAGGAYLHLELAYPSNFLQQIFADAQPKVILTKQQHQANIASHNVTALCLDHNIWREAATTPVTASASNHSLAIIGYSSGTTGKPKGICVSHRATLYAHYKFWEEVQHIPNHGHFAYTTFITWDALSPLIMGQTGHIVADEISFDPHRLLNLIAEQDINHTILTPSLLSCIIQNVDTHTLQDKLSGLNIAWVGGEVMTQALVDQTLAQLPHLTLINNYGPAECFVITQGKLQANDAATPAVCAVGKVLDGMEILLLDEDLQPVPEGAEGNLYATGPCLADGYLSNPALTAQKFIPINGKIFYNTGDAARYLPDDRLLILGRRDGTVKIRSYNVNLLAIEETLRQHPHISDCVVIAYGAEGEDKYLVAYLIRSDDATWQIDPNTYHNPSIANYLQEHLPFYMVPHRYMELDSFPMHAISGKLDKAALPKPSYQPKQPRNIALEPIAADAPVAEQEQLMLALLEDMLPQSTINADDNFFEIGLDSLLAAQLVTRIRELFGVELSVIKIYEHCSVDQLISHLHTHEHTHININWAQQAVLEPAIQPSTSHRTFTQDSNAVLLTGATGYLGSFILAELLSTALQLNVYCLVRSADQIPAIIERLKHYQRWQDHFAERIIAWEGDLSQPNFGWSTTTFTSRAQSVHAIFHAGAWVNMVLPYDQLKTTNVGGTQEILRFASEQIQKPLHYVSTLGIIPSGNPAIYPENDQIDGLIDELNSGYTQTKWVAEKLLWQAIERHIPANIYRIGNIGPDNETFLANTNDTVMILLDACRVLKAAPQQNNWHFEYTPVNFVAKAIVQTALHPAPNNPVYHIAGQQLVSARSVFAAMQQQGIINQIIDMPTWIARLREFVSQQPNNKYTLLEQSLQIEEEFFLETEPFDTRQFTQQMQQCQVPLPIIDADYLLNAKQITL